MSRHPQHRQLHVWLDKRLSDALDAKAQQDKTTKAELTRLALRALVKGLV